MSSALTYLERRFGGYSEITYGCDRSDSAHPLGAPVVVDDAE